MERELIEYPRDWPAEGPIDLLIHDRPHESSTTEWWYLNCHMSMSDNRELSIFAAFFRIKIGLEPETMKPIYAHSVTWAISDASEKKYCFESLLDKNAPKIGLEKLNRGEGTKDPRLRRAIKEVLDKGKIPYPDKMFRDDPKIGVSELNLDFDNNCLRRSDDGSYALDLCRKDISTRCKLVFVPEKEAVRHGEEGVVKGRDGADMFYYFIPRLRVSGVVEMEGQSLDVCEGTGWYDHEFGAVSQIDTNQSEQIQDVAWNWAALQLSDGRELTAYNMEEVNTGKCLGKQAILVDKDGLATRYANILFSPKNMWRSTRTFNDYPTLWTLEIPEIGMVGEISAEFNDQELITVISKPSFWEGRVRFAGKLNDEDLEGIGYVERSGYATVDGLDDFFSAVGEVVRESVREVIPFEPTYERVRDLIASEDRDRYMEGIHITQFVDTLIRPIREIADRGGKSWRSYAALACCDVVGGDSRRFVKWLAMPELMHVGSLIVDDVEDKSGTRRGGCASHLIYGEPLAINAGTAAYFLGQKLLSDTEITSEQKVRLYDLYFQALRAAHGGQAIDIDGLDAFVPEVVETGDGRLLEQRVRAIHRLKTAVPAGVLSQMGALVGGGSEEQIEAVGRYMEAVGIAFQAIDDVLDLRGFSNSLKQRGGDIRQGKVTLPVVKAMQVLGAKDRQYLWNTLQSKPQDEMTVMEVVEMLESCGAVEACVVEANDVVEAAWVDFDRVIEDSFVKMMLRAFGWYVLQRHY